VGQSVATIDQGKVYQGTAGASGGTFTADYAVPTDQVARLRAECIVSIASGGHLASCASLVAEYVVENKNGTVSAPSAIASSNNPANDTTTTFVASAAQASDYIATGAVTLTWSISGTNARCTFTNVGNPSAVNVTVVIKAILVGST